MNDIPGLRTLITTHKGNVTDEVFENLKRFQDNMPAELRTETTQNNDYKLAYKNLSECKVGTAGTDAARGFPCLIWQPSELGRCDVRQEKDLQEGALNSHASAEPGNMILPDSTSGGDDNWFAKIAKSGYKNPKSSWFTLFFGWPEFPNYRLPAPKDFEPDDEEARLMEAGLIDRDQAYWRHVKLYDKMDGNLSGFMREFPRTFEEAFQTPEGRLIDGVILSNACRSTTELNNQHPLIMGIDPAGEGDRTAFVYRRGWVIVGYERFDRMDDALCAQLIVDRIHKKRVDHAFIDMGYGHGIFSFVRSLNVQNITGVYFGSTAMNPMLYVDRRSEMAALFKNWISEGPGGMGGTAKIPNNPEFLADIRAIPKLEFTLKGKFKLASKDEIKSNLKRSPDLFDATILTHAAPVANRNLILPDYAQPLPEQSDFLKTNAVFRQLGEGDTAQAPNSNFKYFNYPR
ncbi:MAG: hypothetical protein KGL39_23140 [Patescibacteria group bacterium]|nr:hypothetical protein [Patescibacteria group bacterium]